MQDSSIVTNPLDSVWPLLLTRLKKQLSQQSYDTWFAPTRQLSASENSIVVEVPNKFCKDWLVEHYNEHITRAVKEIDKGVFDVEFVAGEHALDRAAPTDNDAPAGRDTERRGFAIFTRPFERFAQPQEFNFNKKCIFENFVVGECNRFAHAASLAVAESPAKAYNPLFIYGGVGLGKTHLMQAIGQHILKKHPRVKVLYITSERFTNQLINAIQNRTTQKFREQYRSQDALLIDDIHFLAGKEATQEEFFHTFNTLYDSYKQIVVSSDRPPEEISGLEKRLVSRFVWGLVTDVQPPNLETRVAILRKKIFGEAVVVPDDVIFFIADKIKTNIRELEGALIRVVAYASLMGSKIDTNTAKDVLKEADEEKGREITVEIIQRAVAEHFGISSNDMRSKRRTSRVVYPRQVAMYLAREMTKHSLAELGGFFGGRDHTTVIYACEKIENDIKKDSRVKAVVESVVTKIKKG